MKSTYTLQEYLRLDMFKKSRLKQDNPAEFERLESERLQNFNPATDHEALKELMSNPKTSKVVSGDN